MSELERDPEKLWKQGKNYWSDPSIEQHDSKDVESKNAYSFMQHIKIQFWIALCLLIGIVGASYVQHPMVDQSKNWIKQELNKSFDFMAIAVWYNELFEGSPSFIPRFGNKSEHVLANQRGQESVFPVAGGTLLHSFAELLNGIEIAGSRGAEVRAAEKGRVILVPKQQDSVIIQHANNKLSIYTRLNEVKVDVSDWVEAGTVIGKLAPIEGEDYSVLFFSVKQGDQYIDPLEVITFE